MYRVYRGNLLLNKILLINVKVIYDNVFIIKLMGIGDWGLGIGPNPQSPIPNPQHYIYSIINISLLMIDKILFILIIYLVLYYTNKWRKKIIATDSKIKFV